MAKKWSEIKHKRFERAHEERMRIILAPVPVVRRIGTGSAMPWAGTIVNDNMPGASHAAPGRLAGMTNDDDATMMQRYTEGREDPPEPTTHVDDYSYSLSPWSPPL